jgi:hypothetical protein
MAVERDASEGMRGRAVQVDRPDWTALEQLVSAELADRFIWMSEVELQDGTRVQVYKDNSAGRFLNLSQARQAFHYRDGRYHDVDPRTALLGLYIDLDAGARLDAVEQAALRLALAKLDRDLGEG